MSPRTFTLLASEAAENGEPLVNPYLVGVIALAILLGLLAALIAFGAGREHS